MNNTDQCVKKNNSTFSKSRENIQPPDLMRNIRPASPSSGNFLKNSNTLSLDASEITVAKEAMAIQMEINNDPGLQEIVDNIESGFIDTENIKVLRFCLGHLYECYLDRYCTATGSNIPHYRQKLVSILKLVDRI